MANARDIAKGIPGLLVLGVAGWLWWHWPAGSDKTAESLQADLLAEAKKHMPAQQAQFCDIITKAYAEYAPALDGWRKETNGIAKDAIAKRLEALRDTRDASVYALMAVDKLNLRQWRVKIESIKTSELATNGKTSTYVRLSMSAHCPQAVTIDAEFPLTSAVQRLLGSKHEGDDITIDGQFTGHDVERNTAARAMNWDGFQTQAMRSPTYRLGTIDFAPADQRPGTQ